MSYQQHYGDSRRGSVRGGWDQQGYFGSHGGRGGWEPEPARRNVMAIVGFITGLLPLPPLGLLFSWIGLAQIRRTEQRGRGLARAGITLALAWAVLFTAVGAAFGGKVSRVVFDPGCTQAEAVGREIATQTGAAANDARAGLAALKKSVGQLDEAARASKHDDVKAAILILRGDINQILHAIKTKKGPSERLLAKLQQDGDAVDGLCTF
ncbi:MAG TPA: DUF4190 domain-containing protein [Streptosporangiaceae bacterium]